MTDIEGYVSEADRMIKLAKVDSEAGYATLAVANALMAAAGVLAQIRDQLGLIGELVAADPAISHVVATRQIITEMREELDSLRPTEEEDADDDPEPQQPNGGSPSTLAN